MESYGLFRRALLGMLGTLIGVVTLVLSGRVHHVVTGIRRALLGLTGVGLMLMLPIGVLANELGAPAVMNHPGLVLHDANETLALYCALDADGRLWLQLPGGARFELITSISDPAIANPGDGSFHPFELAEVRSALDGVRYPLAAIDADVFLLPFPRRSGLESAAGPHVILLSPGVRELSREQQHAELTHELGHVVQYSRMSDADADAWDRYRRMRGIVDETLFSASGAHADRPHEIFAEDFRSLFGDALANYSGTIENSTLEPPAEVIGLSDFLRALGGSPVTLRLSATPNPSRGALTFSRSGSQLAPLDLFDVAGRRIVTLSANSTAGAVRWSWDGRDEQGRQVGAAVLFARVRDEGGSATRVTLAP
jgi:hypothetical protein